jgi:hypothetical protein
MVSHLGLVSQVQTHAKTSSNSPHEQDAHAT